MGNKKRFSVDRGFNNIGFSNKISVQMLHFIDKNVFLYYYTEYDINSSIISLEFLRISNIKRRSKK